MKYIKQITFLIAIIPTLSSCNTLISSNAVNIDDFLSRVENPPEIYSSGKNSFFCDPFNFSHTDFGKLILVSINNHPDIKTVELVVQDDNEGAFVVIYYHNGSVETYINKKLSIDKKYLTPNDDWIIAGETDFRHSYSETDSGISFELELTLNNGTDLDISIRENQPKTHKYDFLAAIGADLTEVMRFPFVFLKDAGFLPIEGTAADFRIDGRDFDLTEVPVTVEGRRCYRTVYAFTPLPFFWNEERAGSVPQATAPEDMKYTNGNAEYQLLDNSGHIEIQQIIYKAGTHSATCIFEPAFPDIASLKDGAEVRGKFCLGADDVRAAVAGEYSVSADSDIISIRIQPGKCWQPMPGAPWVSAYSYKAELRKDDTDKYQIDSEWKVN